MTRPEPSEQELLALYREASDAEPGPLLDRRILAAAKADLLLDQKRSRRSAPWWKSLLVPVTTVAIGVLGVSLTWRVVDQQEQELHAITSQMEDVVVEQAPAESVTAPSPPPVAPVIKEPRVAAKAVDEPALAETKKSPPARQNESKDQARPLDSARLAKPARPDGAAPAPMAAPQSVQSAPAQERSAEADAQPFASEIDESSVAGKAEMVAPAAKRRLDSRRAESLDSAAAPATTDDGATPEAWLKHIRELQSAGRDAEVAQSLARFRARYPDHVLPADLRDLK